MQGPIKASQSSDIGVDQRELNELIHRIRKLRWMGMEDEAKIVEVEVAACHDPPGDTVIGGPGETD